MSEWLFSYIFIVLVHWKNSPWIDMLPHSDTISWFRANQCLLFQLALTEKQLTRLGLEPMIYRTRDEYNNHYTTDEVYFIWFLVLIKYFNNREESAHWSKKRKHQPYTVPQNLYFLAVWTRFEWHFYFQIFY